MTNLTLLCKVSIISSYAIKVYNIMRVLLMIKSQTFAAHYSCMHKSIIILVSQFIIENGNCKRS